MLENLEVGVVPDHEQAEAEDPDAAQEGRRRGAGELRKEGVGQDVEDEVEDGELEVAASPEVVEEDDLARDRTDQAEELH